MCPRAPPQSNSSSLSPRTGRSTLSTRVMCVSHPGPSCGVPRELTSDCYNYDHTETGLHSCARPQQHDPVCHTLCPGPHRVGPQRSDRARPAPWERDLNSPPSLPQQRSWQLSTMTVLLRAPTQRHSSSTRTGRCLRATSGVVLLFKVFKDLAEVSFTAPCHPYVPAVARRVRMIYSLPLHRLPPGEATPPSSVFARLYTDRKSVV